MARWLLTRVNAPVGIGCGAGATLRVWTLFPIRAQEQARSLDARARQTRNGQKHTPPKACVSAKNGFFDVSGGLEQLSEGSGNEVDDGHEGVGVSIAAGASPGGLEQAVEALEAGIAVR